MTKQELEKERQELKKLIAKQNKQIEELTLETFGHCPRLSSGELDLDTINKMVKERINKD